MSRIARWIRRLWDRLYVSSTPEDWQPRESFPNRVTRVLDLLDDFSRTE